MPRSVRENGEITVISYHNGNVPMTVSCDDCKIVADVAKCYAIALKDVKVFVNDQAATPQTTLRDGDYVTLSKGSVKSG